MGAARLFLPAAFAVMLAACAADRRTQDLDPNIVPANYKQEVIDTLTQALDDPVNARDAFISEPVLAQVGKDQRYTICVRYNGRNLRQQYVGSKDRIGYFYGGHLNQLVDATPEQCANAAYRPFPELEKLCQAKKCP